MTLISGWSVENQPNQKKTNHVRHVLDRRFMSSARLTTGCGKAGRTSDWGVLTGLLFFTTKRHATCFERIFNGCMLKSMGFRLGTSSVDLCVHFNRTMSRRISISYLLIYKL